MANKLLFIITLLFAFTVNGGTDIGQNPYCVLNMPFSEMSGRTAIDHSREGNNANTYAGPEWTNDYGRCLDFNGSSDGIKVLDDNSLDIAGDYTLMYWVNPDGTPAAPDFLSAKVEDSGGNTRAYYVFHYTDNTIVYYHGTGSGAVGVQSTTTLTHNVWQHLAFRMDTVGDTMKIYINGVERGSVAFTATPSVNSADLLIGCLSGVSGFSDGWFDGKMDEVKIYNRALSITEIKNIYNKGRKDLKKLR